MLLQVFDPERKPQPHGVNLASFIQPFQGFISDSGKTRRRPSALVHPIAFLHTVYQEAFFWVRS